MIEIDQTNESMSLAIDIAEKAPADLNFVRITNFILAHRCYEVVGLRRVKQDPCMQTIDEMVEAIYMDKDTFLQVMKRMMRIINERAMTANADSSPNNNTTPYKAAL